MLLTARDKYAIEFLLFIINKIVCFLFVEKKNLYARVLVKKHDENKI